MKTHTLIITLTLAALSLMGCQSVQEPVLANRTKPGNIYLIGGGFDVFSTGLKNVTERLEADGYNAQYLSGANWSDLAQKIDHAVVMREIDGPIILVGHCWGGRDAVRVAKHLQPHRVDIEALVLLDGFHMGPVPGNVKSCYHIYKSGVPPFSLVDEVELESDRTELISFDVRDAEDPALHKVGMAHWNMTNYEIIQDKLEEAIRRYLPAGRREVVSTGEVSAPKPAKRK